MRRLILVFFLIADPAAAQYMYSSAWFAQKHCPGDTVVWLNAKTHIYYFATDDLYGMTEAGAFVCQQDADSSGDRPASAVKDQ